ncbi:MAG: DUF378 domain-containing protein [bacterium]
MEYMWLIYAAKFLSAIGAINWGLYKFLNLDMVDFLLVPGKNRNLKLLVYLLIALSGLYLLLYMFWK